MRREDFRAGAVPSLPTEACEGRIPISVESQAISSPFVS